MINPRVADVTAFPDDKSAYGVIGMGGNVREWSATLNPDPAFDNQRGTLGSSFNADMGDAEKKAEVKFVEYRFVFLREPATGCRCVTTLPFDDR